MKSHGLVRHLSFVLMMVISHAPALSGDNLIVLHLRTEYKSDPLCIDVLQPRMSWKISSGLRNTMQSAYALQCAATEENLTSEKKLLWKTKVNSDQSVHVVYEGSALSSRQRVYWRVKIWDNHGRVSDWSEPAFWEMGLLDEKDWTASWIEADIEEDTLTSQPAQYFRKTFQLKKPVRSARLYITSHGLYDAFLNHERIGDQVFTPGWTSYHKRLQYQAYDIAGLLKKGENALGVVLGDGWYRGFLGWSDNRNSYGKKLAVLAQLEIVYTDGSRQTIISDKSWKAVNSGPILMSDIYNGEVYDARKEWTGWTKSDFDASSWGSVIENTRPQNQLAASCGPPVKKIETIEPVRVIQKADSSIILDMGQNMVGRLRLMVTGERGTVITMRHAEALDKNGDFYTENLRSAKQTVTYICRGGGQEIFEPHFTFQGFRFVELTGYPGTPGPYSIIGIVIHSDMTPTGEFVCSDSLINQLQQNIQWGLKGNFVDVPTDCPQRDERLGWTGDAQVFASTACFNMDAASFYTKWMRDLALDQGPDGKVPDVIPDVLNGGGHTGWADAGIIVPWTVYQNYGDKRILRDQYKSMQAWVHYMQNRAGDDYLWNKDWHYGDWLSFDAGSPAYMGAYTETDLIATAYFAYSTGLLSQIAQVIGKPDDARVYQDLSDNIKKAFLDEFVTPNGRLVSNTQTAYTLALSMNLLPDALKMKAVQNLDIEVARFGHITTGFLGTPWICRTLSDNGFTDTAYLLLNRKEYPSWLYPVTRGATTLWERWDGIRPDSTFQDPGMNSLNHYAYGAIGKWLYSTVAGIDIDPAHPGYKHIIIRPQPGGGLTHAKAEIKTMYGLASTAWEKEGDQIRMTVIIPPNTTASVYPPVSDVDELSVEGGVHPEKDVEGKPVIQIGSGRYVIHCIQKKNEEEPQ